MINSNCTVQKFAISCCGQLVNSIRADGTPDTASSVNGITYFDAPNLAQDYIRQCTTYAIIAGYYNSLSNYKYEVTSVVISTQNLQIECNNTKYMLSEILYSQYNSISNMTGLVKTMVKFGFGDFCNSIDEVHKLLDDHKYTGVLDLNMPPYMRDNPELFMDTGILTCDGDLKGAILLTTPDDMLDALKFKR